MVSSRFVIAAVTTVASLGSASTALAGDAPSGPLTYPALVEERLVRVQSALDRAAVAADEHQPNAAASTLMSARSNLRKAWTSAKYIIDNAPPPPPPVDDLAARSFHAKAFTRSGRLKIRSLPAATRKSKRSARAAQDLVPTGPAATIYDTAFAVLSLQHRMATLSTGLIDTAHSTLLSSLSTSLFTALNGRDQAIAYIKSIDVAPPPPPDDLAPVAQAADDPEPVGWAVVMPNVAPQIDDELLQIRGTQASGPLRAGTQRVLAAALTQSTATQGVVNTAWPPAPPVDD